MTWARRLEALIAKFLGFEPAPVARFRIKRSPRYVPTWHGARNGRAHPSAAAEGLTPDERQALETVEREHRILLETLRDVLRRRTRGQGAS